MCETSRHASAFNKALRCHQPIWLTEYVLKIVIVLFLSPVFVLSNYNTGKTQYEAIYNISYTVLNKTQSKSYHDGRFGVTKTKNAILKVAPAHGMIVHIRTKENKTDGCTDYNFKIPSVKWIALISRGTCSFDEKIQRAGKTYNASAVVVYNQTANIPDDTISIMDISVEDVIAISIPSKQGKTFAELADKGYNITMYIFKGKEIKDDNSNDKNPSKTSVVFVSVSFIVLMIISLAWLVFYYIQRFRYAHAKERLARRLASAAKKAIAKIPQKTVKNGDKELTAEFDQCAVCIEGYKAHDVIRILPCKHVFHKSCVDPWLLDQRSCPMCKLDILRAYGLHVGSSEDSVHHDGESGTQMNPVEELEHTSMDDEQSIDGEVKVLLLPQHLQDGEGEGSSSGVGSKQFVCEPSQDAVHSSDSDFTELHSLVDNMGATVTVESGQGEPDKGVTEEKEAA